MQVRPFEGKKILIAGGTGSIGKTLVRRLLQGADGHPEKVIVFSRDEAKQHSMRIEYQRLAAASDETIHRDFQRKLEFHIGDVRDYHSVASALRNVDIVFNAAAMKQVPTCEYFPYEAARTNIEGPENLVRAIGSQALPVETVVGISTDKACKPVSAMGMTKAIQERIFIQANMRCPGTRFVCARSGNVLGSRGSVVPLFHEQIRKGGPVTITSAEMTRFLLDLDEAVDTVLAAAKHAMPGETFVPRAPSALIANVAKALIGDRDIRIEATGVRPGEKIHEVLVGEEEALRTVARGKYYAIKPMLPEICNDATGDGSLTRQYSSGDNVMDLPQTLALLKARGLTLEDAI